MKRQPVNVEAALAKGKPYGRRAVWAAIRELGTFTRADLRLKLPQVKKHVIYEYLSALVRGGYVEAGVMIRRPLSTGSERQYHLARDIGVDAPRLRKDGSELSPTGQQNTWMAMKVIGWFTPESLTGAASVNGVVVAFSAAEEYVKHLYKAGYLQQSGDGKQYRLIDDTGGLAPMVQRTKVVFDPNVNRLRWHEELEP